MQDKRPFANVPRRLLTVATIVGGLIGLALSNVLQWDMIQSFVFTLIIALICILITIVGYRTLHADKPNGGKQ
jgi:hypothetical protein